MDKDLFFLEQKRLCDEIERHRVNLTERICRKKASFLSIARLPKFLAGTAVKVMMAKWGLSLVRTMRKAAIAFSLGGIFTVSAFSAPTGKLGLGVVVGDPIGPTLKYWLSSQQAIAVGVGFDEDPIFYADFLWHNWGLVNKNPGSGDIGFYAGVGPRWEVFDHRDDEFGFRVPLGVSFLLNRSPIEIFAEIAPVFEVSPETDTEIDGGIGVRFLF